MERTYIAIDLKSFYASVECVERGLDPLTTNLVVADESRTDKTICLAVSPALKSLGIPGRPRLFEAKEKVRQANALRKGLLGRRNFRGSSRDLRELEADPALEVDFYIAPPQMARYMQVSTQIYGIYLKYISPEDIHVYSIDEVFIDATAYLRTYSMTARELAMTMIREVLRETGITATAGIGTNLYLAKIAMDIMAKKMPADRDGVRIAELDEMGYRRALWDHRPLTDFWRVGRGYSRKLEAAGLYTMGDIARYSLLNEERLYKMFGVQAELLIDHAWGWEPCTIAAIKAYRPESSSISTGQVLSRPYSFEKARLIVREMTDLLVLDMADKELAADQVVLNVVYDTENVGKNYTGALETDHYGRQAPKAAHGSQNLGGYTTSTKQILEAVTALYDRITDPSLTVRRIYVVANHILPWDSLPEEVPEQLDLFTDPDELARRRQVQQERLCRERRRQKAVLAIQKKYGKNAILKGMNFLEGATTRERNGTVGGHKA